MTRNEVIASLRDQARDKRSLANGDAGSVFTHDANALRLALMLITKMPRFVSVKKGYPKEIYGTYLCRYKFAEGNCMAFYQVLKWYGIDDVPHFQHEGEKDGLRVTHWMKVPEIREE